MSRQHVKYGGIKGTYFQWCAVRLQYPRQDRQYESAMLLWVYWGRCMKWMCMGETVYSILLYMEVMNNVCLLCVYIFFPKLYTYENTISATWRGTFIGCTVLSYYSRPLKLYKQHISFTNKVSSNRENIYHVPNYWLPQVLLHTRDKIHLSTEQTSGVICVKLHPSFLYCKENFLNQLP